MSKFTFTAALLAVIVTAGFTTQAADNKPAGKDEPAPVGYEGTPQIPGSKWRVHQAERPQPRVVTPGGSCVEGAAQPPADAVVLFDGKDLSKWCNDKGGPAKWKVENGYIEVVPKTGYREPPATIFLNPVEGCGSVCGVAAGMMSPLVVGFLTLVSLFWFRVLFFGGWELPPQTARRGNNLNRMICS